MQALIHRRHVLGLLTAASALPSRSFAGVARRRSEIRAALARRFIDEGTAGTFVGYKVDEYLVIASDKNRSEQAMLPASTFKIPNSVIALETGVVGDPDKDVFKWDGVVRSIEAWNRDHTLRSAIAASTVPVYQEIARRIGAERMQKFVDLFEYGNRDIGGGIDQFWLTGNLLLTQSSRSILSIVCGAACCRYPNAARNWFAISCRSRYPAIPSFAPRADCWARRSASRRSAGWWGGLRKTDSICAQSRYSRATSHPWSHEADATMPQRYRRHLIRIIKRAWRKP
jgi:hypothetical protein